VVAAEENDDRSRNDNKQSIPYYERKNSEDKVRDFPNVMWN